MASEKEIEWSSDLNDIILTWKEIVSLHHSLNDEFEKMFSFDAPKANKILSAVRSSMVLFEKEFNAFHRLDLCGSPSEKCHRAAVEWLRHLIEAERAHLQQVEIAVAYRTKAANLNEREEQKLLRNMGEAERKVLEKGDKLIRGEMNMAITLFLLCQQHPEVFHNVSSRLSALYGIGFASEDGRHFVFPFE